MRKLKFKFDRISLETIYLPSLDLYSNTVMLNNCSQYEKDELEKMQIQAARIGANKLVSSNALYRETLH